LLHVFRTSSRANITLSAKKKRKILKQLRRVESEKSQMEGNVEQVNVIEQQQNLSAYSDIVSSTFVANHHLKMTKYTKNHMPTFKC